MDKYRVKYSLGKLEGLNPGDATPKLTQAEVEHYLGLGLIETEDEYQARQEAQAKAEAEYQAQQPTDTVQTASLSQVISPERMQELVTEEEDRMLEPHKGKSGWYQFGEGDEVVKVQGREAALEELAKRLNAEAAK